MAVAVIAISVPHTASADPKPVGTWGWTTGSATYVRIRPGSQTPAVAKVARHTQLMVWGTFNGWYRVETTDHKFGWIYHDYVNVPKADKLHELSHFKAKKASDQTGHQTLYGSPDQLKKYYARYGASGAKRGLARQGVRIVSGSDHNKANKPVAVKTVSVNVKSSAKPAAKPVTPRTVTVNIPNADMPPSLPGGAAVAEKTTAPQPVVIRGTATHKTSEARPANLPNITAEDIMSARAEYLRKLPASRHKTRPSAQPRREAPAPKPQATPETATVQHSAYEINGEPVIRTADFETSPVPVKGAEVSPASPISGQPAGDPAVNFQTISYSKGSKEKNSQAKKSSAAPSRGGSPRDYARWAAANKKFGTGMAQQALSYRGMPYISGASNPNRGFDCSGLVYYLLRQRGYNPPRTAAGLAHFGKPVAKKDLRPGDLVFFANTYKHGVSHVGVYIGNNKFVHAANHRSGVKTDSLNSSYYKRKYYCARRVK